MSTMSTIELALQEHNIPQLEVNQMFIHEATTKLQQNSVQKRSEQIKEMHSLCMSVSVMWFLM